jgi:chitin disaccharide deacetylase
MPWIEFMKSRLHAARVLHNDQIFGLADSGAMDEEKILEILARLPAGVTEIYLHPATESGAAIAASMSAYRHLEELRALLSPRVRTAIDRAGVACGGYGDLQ